MLSGQATNKISYYKYFREMTVVNDDLRETGKDTDMTFQKDTNPYLLWEGGGREIPKTLPV
jgi:hypothetical protein